MRKSAQSSARGLQLAALACVAVAGGLLWTVWGWNPRAALAGTYFYFWFLLCLCGELLRTRTASGQSTRTMAACPHFACLLVLPRPEAMAVVGFACMVAGRLIHRRSWWESTFGAGVVMCVVGLARLAFDALAADNLRPSALVAAGHYVPILAAAAVYFVATFVARCVWAAVEEGSTPWKVSGDQFGSRFDLLTAGALLSLGSLLAVQFKMAGALGAIALVIPVVVAKYASDHFALMGKNGGVSATSRERQKIAA